MLQEKLEGYFQFEIIAEFEPHLISFGFGNGRSESQRITANLIAVVGSNLRRFADESGITSDFQLVLSYPDTPDELFFISIYDIYSKITLQSGNKIDVEELVDDEVVNKIKSGFYDKKTKENKVKREDNSIIIWADAESLQIAYHYKDGLRELRLDEINYKPTTEAIYFKCFCYMRRQTRTFKADTFNNAIIYQDQEYTLDGFLNDVLCINSDDLAQILNK